MAPFVATLGYKFNTDDGLRATWCSTASSRSSARDGDVFCPCRVRTGVYPEDVKIVCPCIPFYLDDFAAMRKCWCGLFIRTDVEDGSELHGVIERPPGPGRGRASPPSTTCATGRRKARQDRQARRSRCSAPTSEWHALSQRLPALGRPAGGGAGEGEFVDVPVARLAVRRPRRARPTTRTPT